MLELKVPLLNDHNSINELTQQLVDLFPKFLSWLISFIILCKFWFNHHHILGLARHANYAMVWMNAIFRMSQSFVPFPTALMGEYPNNPLAVSFFGCVMAVNTLLVITLHAYIARRLIKPELVGTEKLNFVHQALIGPTSYLIGAVGAWFSIYIAFLMYIITPLFYIVLQQSQADAKVRED